MFSRYRNYEGERDRPLTERETGHLNRLMDEATVVVDKFVERDPEQARWHARICESFEGTQVSVIATPWDRALANRVPLDLGAVAGATLDAKLAMAEQVLRGVDRADRRRHGLPEPEAEESGSGQRDPAEPPQPSPPPPAPAAGPDNGGAEPDTADIPVIAAPPEPDGGEDWADTPHVRIIPTQPGPDDAGDWADTPHVRIIPARTEPDGPGIEPGPSV